MSDEISVLIVDDSAMMRNLIGRMIEETPGLVVAEKAMNGNFALQKIPRVNPDIIILDLEMPEMNGIEFLKERKKQGIDIPVVILSSIAEKGAKITMEALDLGASDFVTKPSGSISVDIHTVRDTLIPMIFAFGSTYRRLHGKRVSLEKPVNLPANNNIQQPKLQQEILKETVQPEESLSSVSAKTPPQQLRKPGKIEVIAIGISTGGPDALRQVFSKLDPKINVPILVVQHMPPGFTTEFARSLNNICPFAVKEAEDEDQIKPGCIYIAPGNRHMEAERKAYNTIIRLSDTPQVSGHRPSADVLFASVAITYSNHALGVIMTGMGRDGAKQLGNIYREGGITLGQDEASSVVYGMPRAAFEMGHVNEQVSLNDMPGRISEIVREYSIF